MNVSHQHSDAMPRVLRRFAAYLRSSPLKRQLLGEGAWVVFGQLASAVGLFLGMRILTEFVAPSVFGVVSLLLGVVTFGSATFCVPQLQAAIRLYPELAPQGQIQILRTTIGRSLRWTTGSLVLLILLSGIVVGIFSNVSYWTFVILACLLVSEILRSLETNLLSAARRQRAFAIWTAAEKCGRPFLAILFVWLLGATPQSVLLGYFIATAAILVAYHLGQPKAAAPLPSDPAQEADLAKQVWQYAFPLMPLALVAWITSLSDRYLIGGMLGLQAVGLYAAAYGLTSRLLSTFPGTFLFLTLRPVYFQAVTDRNGRLEKKTLRLWFSSSLILCFILILILSLTAKIAVQWLLAPSYHSCWTIMPILATAFAMMEWAQIFNTVSLAHKKSKNVLLSETSAAIAMLISIIPATMWLGLPGAALATSLAYLAQLVTAYLLARPYLISTENGRILA